jgi:hypothetical protein
MQQPQQHADAAHPHHPGAAAGAATAASATAAGGQGLWCQLLELPSLQQLVLGSAHLSQQLNLTGNLQDSLGSSQCSSANLTADFTSSGGSGLQGCDSNSAGGSGGNSRRGPGTGSFGESCEPVSAYVCPTGAWSGISGIKVRSQAMLYAYSSILGGIYKADVAWFLPFPVLPYITFPVLPHALMSSCLPCQQTDIGHMAVCTVCRCRFALMQWVCLDCAVALLWLFYMLPCCATGSPAHGGRPQLALRCHHRRVSFLCRCWGCLHDVVPCTSRPKQCGLGPDHTSGPCWHSSAVNNSCTCGVV